MWHEITYPFSNFNGKAVEVWEWKNYFILLVLVDVITYPYWHTFFIRRLINIITQFLHMIQTGKWDTSVYFSRVALLFNRRYSTKPWRYHYFLHCASCFGGPIVLWPASAIFYLKQGGFSWIERNIKPYGNEIRCFLGIIKYIISWYMRTEKANEIKGLAGA